MGQSVGVGLAVIVAADGGHGSAQDAIVEVNRRLSAFGGLFLFGAKDFGVLATGSVDGGIEELRVRGVRFEGLAGALEFFALAIDSGDRCSIHHRGVDALLAGIEEEVGLAQQRPAIGGTEEIHGRGHSNKSNEKESAEDFQYRFHSFRPPVRST